MLEYFTEKTVQTFYATLHCCSQYTTCVFMRVLFKFIIFILFKYEKTHPWFNHAHYPLCTELSYFIWVSRHVTLLWPYVFICQRNYWKTLAKNVLQLNEHGLKWMNIFSRMSRSFAVLASELANLNIQSTVCWVFKLKKKKSSSINKRFTFIFNISCVLSHQVTILLSVEVDP